MMRLGLGACTVPAMVLTGCVSLSNLQRAETMGAGNWQVGTEATAQGPDFPYLPGVGVSFREGVTDTLDLGVRASLSGAEGDLKLQLTKRRYSSVTVSLAPSIGGWPGSTSSGNAVCAKSCPISVTGFTNVSLPVLIGIPLGLNEFVISAGIVDWTQWTELDPISRAGPPVPLVSSFVRGSSITAENTVFANLTIGFAIWLSRRFQIVPEAGFAVPVGEWPVSRQTLTNEGLTPPPYGAQIVPHVGVGFLIGN